MNTLARTLPKALCLVAAASMAGCVTAHFEASNGDIRTVRHFGVMRIEPTRSGASLTGSMSGIGLVDTPMGWTVGYTRQRWALPGDKCGAVVWLPPGGVDEQTREALVRAAGVCLIEAEPEISSQQLSTKEETL